MTVMDLEPLWDLNTTLFWMPSADAGLRETCRQSIILFIPDIVILNSLTKTTQIQNTMTKLNTVILLEA